MYAEAINQAYLFGIYSICGIIIGIFFDLFRILRRSFKTPDIVTYIEDIIFVFNNGELRLYIFFAIILGIAIYLLTISKFFIKINVKILITLKNFIKKILLILVYPLRLFKNIICKTILKPFRILTININNVLKAKKMKKNKKTTEDKKDFSK